MDYAQSPAMSPADLEGRTKSFAIAVVRFCSRLRLGPVLEPLVKQLVRSGTSVGANYRGARRGRSYREFASKLSISAEEADETKYWLEVMKHGLDGSLPGLDDLLGEATELCAILTTARNTATERLKRRTSQALCLALFCAASYFAFW